MSDDATREALMLLDLGQKLINSIVAGQILGHTTVRGQQPYVHTDDPAAAVAMAYGAGSLTAAAEALGRLRAAHGLSPDGAARTAMGRVGEQLVADANERSA